MSSDSGSRARGSPGRGRARWWLALGIPVVLLLGVEIAVRVLADRDSRWNTRLGANKVYDPVAYFRNRPFHRPGVNELGYRAPNDLAHAKPEAAVRILYLGDSNSVTPLDENFPVQVQRILEGEDGIDVETVNAGVPGYSSENARLLFEHELSRFDADHLVVYLGWNDLGQYGPEGLPYKRLRTGYDVGAAERLLSSVYTVRFVYALQRVLRRRQPGFNEPMRGAERALYEAYRPDHFYDNLRSILRLAKQRYPNVYVLTLATLTNPDPSEAELAKAHFPVGMSKNMAKLHHLVMRYDRAVREVARQEGATLVDVQPLFATPEARRHFTDSCHFDGVGAELVARLLVTRMRERGL